MRSWAVVVEGVPRTKKNSSVLVRGHALLLPSEAWKKWNREARVEVAAGPDRGFSVADLMTYAWPWDWKKPKRGTKNPRPKPATLIPRGIGLNCRAAFYRHANVGDAVGFYQGVADLLEAHGIVDNDRQIVSWDGSRLRKDKDRPRVEIVLEELPEDLFPLLPDEEPSDSVVGLGG